MSTKNAGHWEVRTVGWPHAKTSSGDMRRQVARMGSVTVALSAGIRAEGGVRR